MTKTTILLMIAVIAVLTAALLAEQPAAKAAAYGLSNPDALAAVKRFDVAEQTASRAYAAAMTQAREKLVAELQKVQDRVTKSGNLEEALKVREAINQIKAGQ